MPKIQRHAIANPDSAIAAEEPESTVPKLKGQLGKEFLGIGLPALVQLAAEPLAGLVDTAYLGRLGPAALGGAGVAVSAQYAVGKLYNDPLLRTSISLVASQQGRRKGEASKDNKDLSVAVSTALLLAVTVGLIQMVFCFFAASSIIQGYGVQQSNNMWYSALSYLKIRALGTPAATLWLVSNGVFRGLGDTRTPLAYSLFFTGLNAVLDPFFIFTLGFGASGAAAGTAIAQYAALIPLLLALNRKVKIDIRGQGKALVVSLKSYLEAGSYVLFRTIGKVWAYSICAKQAALLGTISAAAYTLTFQLGVATTQICEAVAVAVQTLLARQLSDTTTHSPSVRRQLVEYLINRSILLGGGVATVLSLFTFFQRQSILAGLTTNVAVQQVAAGIFPMVLVTQVLKGLAYPVNGIIMGGLDWRISMASMWASNFACIGLLEFFKRTGALSLNQIWTALAVFMGTQVVTGVLRYSSRTGVWKILRE